MRIFDCLLLLLFVFVFVLVVFVVVVVVVAVRFVFRNEPCYTVPTFQQTSSRDQLETVKSVCPTSGTISGIGDSSVVRAPDS